MTQTIRLRKLQEPIYLSRLLDALIVRAALVPLDAYQVRDVAAVPTELRNIAKLAVHSGRAWSCWAYGGRTWMFIGEMTLAISRERGRPALQVDVHEDNGLKTSGLWMLDGDGKWQLCAD